MLACRLHVPGPARDRPLAVEDAPDPVPDSDEIVVRVRACAVCRTDLHVVEGELPQRRTPVIPGHQIVGAVTSAGRNVRDMPAGTRVGVAWLHRTCGTCRFCTGGRENLCESARFTGWTEDGGFAEFVKAPVAFVYRLPEPLDDVAAAPLLCAGIVGYRALRLSGIASWSGARLGIYGFGAAGHIAIQLARARGADVFVMTRDRVRHQALASELGARWVGGVADAPPVPLDAAIVFAPAGSLVPAALAAVDRGGTVVLGGIHMSSIPEMPYALLYQERSLRSVTNNTRADGRGFLAEAARVGVRTHTETFPLREANEALARLGSDAIRGAAVLVVQ